LDFVCKGLKCAALVRGSSDPVFFKLNDRLESESGSSDLQLENPDKIGGGGLGEVDDNQLWGNRSICLLTDSFGKRGAGKMLF
jgi:hypothetical protein